MRSAASRFEVLTPLLRALPNSDPQSSRRDLTPEQRAALSFIRSYIDSHSWDFGLSVVTRRDCLSDTVGQFGWDFRVGTYSDPRKDMVTIRVIFVPTFPGSSPTSWRPLGSKRNRLWDRVYGL